MTVRSTPSIVVTRTHVNVAVPFISLLPIWAVSFCAAFGSYRSFIVIPVASFQVTQTVALIEFVTACPGVATRDSVPHPSVHNAAT